MSASQTELSAPSPDYFYHDAVISPPITAAGTYYVRVSYSTVAFEGSTYNLDVSLVPAATSEPVPISPSRIGGIVGAAMPRPSSSTVG